MIHSLWFIMGQYQLWCVHFVPAHQTGRPIAKAVSLLLYLLLSLNQRQQSHVNSSFIMYHVIMRSLPPSHGCHVMYQSSIPKVHSIHATWNYWIYIHRYLFVHLLQVFFKKFFNLIDHKPGAFLLLNLIYRRPYIQLEFTLTEFWMCGCR